MKELDFSPLDAAKITQMEFASIAGVSRVTVNNWVHKRLGVHEARASRVEKLLGALRAAVEQEKLPLANTPRAQRSSAIKRVVLEVLSSPKQ